ncbi:hypothetical protein [Metabacillus indicus]|uniref:hypothetical protein n=1 Tax=Metabacillus indicus TaxID=246786 RepID=UPI0004933049|nr:hypothetical protein [Metabacillus indicus]KEZ48826.1 hypothetical protein AZ46_0218305 [Metabacillus indicus LMG 22858]
MTDNRVSIRVNLLVLYGISAFLLNSVLRNSLMVYSGHSFPDVNYICLLVIFYEMLRVFWINKIKKSSFFIFAGAVVFSILVEISNIFGNSTIGHSVLLFTLLPGILIIAFYFNESVDCKLVLTRFLKVFNVFITLILALGILDYFLGGVINTMLALRFSNPEWAKMITTENLTFGFRMVTIIGSPLMNAFFALTLIVLNNIYNVYISERKWLTLFFNIFGLVAIILTGSRTALLLGAIFVFVSMFNSVRNIKKILIIAAALTVFVLSVNSVFFQKTIGVRFSNDMLSDGRFYLLQNVIEGSYGKIHVLSGGGYNYSRALTSTGSAMQNFELPLLMFLYDYGLSATLIFYLIFGVYPCVKMIKNRAYFALLGYIVLFLHLNSSNILAQKYDFCMMLSFIILVVINCKGGFKNNMESRKRI